MVQKSGSDHQLRLVVYPIIPYRVLAPFQVVVWDFFHEQYHGYIGMYIISYGYMRNLLPPQKKIRQRLGS